MSATRRIASYSYRCECGKRFRTEREISRHRNMGICAPYAAHGVTRNDETVSPAEVWEHGYRLGREHALKGWPSVLDDDWETGEPLAEPLSIADVLQD